MMHNKELWNERYDIAAQKIIAIQFVIDTLEDALNSYIKNANDNGGRGEANPYCVDAVDICKEALLPKLLDANRNKNIADKKLALGHLDYCEDFVDSLLSDLRDEK